MEIRKLKVDSKAQQEGDTVDCSPFGFVDLFVTTRSIRSRRYLIRREALERKRTKEKQKDTALPANERLSLNDDDRLAIARQALREECLIKIEGLTDGGRPIDSAAALALLDDPDYDPLFNACFQAAAAVGHPLDDLEDDAGNSQRPSDGSSTTAAPQASSAS